MQFTYLIKLGQRSPRRFVYLNQRHEDQISRAIGAIESRKARLDQDIRTVDINPDKAIKVAMAEIYNIAAMAREQITTKPYEKLSPEYKAFLDRLTTARKKVEKSIEENRAVYEAESKIVHKEAELKVLIPAKSIDIERISASRDASRLGALLQIIEWSKGQIEALGSIPATSLKDRQDRMIAELQAIVKSAETTKTEIINYHRKKITSRDSDLTLLEERLDPQNRYLHSSIMDEQYYLSQQNFLCYLEMLSTSAPELMNDPEIRSMLESRRSRFESALDHLRGSVTDSDQMKIFNMNWRNYLTQRENLHKAIATLQIQKEQNASAQKIHETEQWLAGARQGVMKSLRGLSGNYVNMLREQASDDQGIIDPEYYARLSEEQIIDSKLRMAKIVPETPSALPAGVEEATSQLIASAKQNKSKNKNI